MWGVYPDQDGGKLEARVEDVTSIRQSPSRLPPQFANKLYKAGESGMGYCVFTLLFSDQSRQAYLTGNAVDFLEYPEDKTPSDVVAVLPHVGLDEEHLQSWLYYWCLHSG